MQHDIELLKRRSTFRGYYLTGQYDIWRVRVGKGEISIWAFVRTTDDSTVVRKIQCYDLRLDLHPDKKNIKRQLAWAINEWYQEHKDTKPSWK